MIIHFTHPSPPCQTRGGDVPSDHHQLRGEAEGDDAGEPGAEGVPEQHAKGAGGPAEQTRGQGHGEERRPAPSALGHRGFAPSTVTASS